MASSRQETPPEGAGVSQLGTEFSLASVLKLYQYIRPKLTADVKKAFELFIRIKEENPADAIVKFSEIGRVMEEGGNDEHKMDLS